MPAYKVNKKGKTKWVAQFYYTDWQGSRKKKFKRGFANKREADAWEREFLERQANGTEGMTFAALVDIYLEDCRSRLKPTTFAGKDCIVRSKLLPYFGKCFIAEITPAQVRKWQNHLLTAEYKPTSLRAINAQLSAIFNFAVRYYRLPTNPAKLAGSIGKQNAERINFWTLEEFQKFAAAIADKPLYYAAFNVLFWTGCRSGELLALTFADIDFNNKKLTINKSYTRLNRKDLIQAPKTAKSNRVLTLPDPLVDILKCYIKTLYEPQPNERIFETPKYHLSREMARGCELSGVKKIRVHDLRHSHASLLIEMGCDPLLIKERLGHEKIQTTLNTYSHLYPNKQNEVADKLGKIMEN